MEKDKALEAALSQIERAFGKGSIMRLGQSTNIDIEAVSTGSLGIDIAALLLNRRKKAAHVHLSMPNTLWIRLMPKKSALMSKIY